MLQLFNSRRKQRSELGEPIIVVSGLPRSGTSMIMKMLVATGYDVVHDSVRKPDIDNPDGYYEDERVRNLADNLDKAWLREARGRAIKVISFLLKNLPDSNTYKIIFVQRHLDEVLASQNKMLEHRGIASDTSNEEMRKLYQQHLEQTYELIEKRRTMSMLKIEYRDMIEGTMAQAQSINEYIGGGLDVARMAAVINKNLYRNRAR
jgi:ElaB/YqjD/DUF883 family membrane-anchored ribosome-binding protein